MMKIEREMEGNREMGISCGLTDVNMNYHTSKEWG